MRKLAVIVVLLVSTSLSAQQDKRNGLFVFVSNPGYTESKSSGHQWDGAFGLALQRMFTPHVSGELTVSGQRDIMRSVSFNPDGTFGEGRTFVAYSFPTDLTARYHFFTDNSWKPYVGAGARWSPSAGRALLDLTGGVVWQFRPTFGLRFDGKLLLGTESRFDSRFNPSVGLTWRF